VRARAPGKLVLSGAYAVLEGATALVCAVDRYVEADSEREPPLVTAEVAEAIARGMMPRAVGFDAGALRAGDRKLGLGSSAAILVASLALTSTARDERLADAVFPDALDAHRAAQGGGSGVDVAASAYGGVLACRRQGGELEVTPHRLPAGLCIEAWACPAAASTANMLRAVRDFAARDATSYRRVIDRAAEGSERALAAADAAAYVAAVEQQREALAQLGLHAGVPIVTSDLALLGPIARLDGACLLPSGAGGGDIALYCAPAPSPPHFRARAEQAGLFLVPMVVGARGVHRVTV
jgi:phosphomevalonate kinase